MTSGVGLLELSPFTKIDVNGTQACECLQWLCTSNIDVEVGRAVYTQMLNQQGGIEADITVTRMGEDSFRVTSGAATRWKDLAWLRTSGRPFEVSIFDTTSAEAAIGIMGPKSLAMLEELSGEDLSHAAFPFSTVKEISIGFNSVRATRVSFVGEMGWELSISTEQAQAVYQTLVAAGKEFGLVHVGHMALDSCRLEKGYKHWGHDIGMEDTPLETGLSFTIDWDKDFFGKEALLTQKETGVTRRLLSFAVKDGHPLLLHDEPVFRNGELVGQTTSGGRGFRTGRSLCFATVRLLEGLSLKDYRDADFEISIAGVRHALEPLTRAAFDPKNERLKG